MALTQFISNANIGFSPHTAALVLLREVRAGDEFSRVKTSIGLPNLFITAHQFAEEASAIKLQTLSLV